MDPFNPSADPSSSGDPRQQSVNITMPGGFEPFPVPLPVMYEIYLTVVSTSINYAAQIGASFIMLCVVLTMTAKARFGRLPTLLNVANLVVSVVRCTLLALFATSTYMEPYTLYSGDMTYVAANDTRVSVAACVVVVPQMLLIEVALFVQAWSMMQLWPRAWKWAVLVVSAVLSVVTFAFKCATVSLQIRSILEPWIPPLWPRTADLFLTTTMICWFCLMFNVRLVMHMWTNRTILPTGKGLSAMEVLVMANGILMFVPVIFSGLYIARIGNFESGSLVSTSVVLILPLAALVAQRLTPGSGTAVAGGSGGGGPFSHGIGNGNTLINSNGGGSSSRRGFLSNFSSHNNNMTNTTTTTSSGKTHSYAVPKLSTKVTAGGPVPPPLPMTEKKMDPID